MECWLCSIGEHIHYLVIIFFAGPSNNSGPTYVELNFKGTVYGCAQIVVTIIIDHFHSSTDGDCKGIVNIYTEGFCWYLY